MVLVPSRSRRRNSRNWSLGYALAGLVLVCVAVGLLSGQPQEPPLNVVWITFDALRPDHLTHNGYRRATSPQLDAFAKQAVRFTSAHSQGTETPPAMSSLYTATHVHTHGVEAFTSKRLRKLPMDLPRLLRVAGYSTAFFSGHAGMTAFADSLGFEKFISVGLPADQITAQALAWLRAKRAAPLLLHVHYFEPHLGAHISQRDARFFEGDGLDNPDRRGQLVAPERELLKAHQDPSGNVDVQRLLRRYDGAVRLGDRQFGRVLAALKQLKLLERTIVVVSADHGEYLGESDMVSQKDRLHEHGGAPSELVTRVPLLIRVPGVKPGVVSAPVQHVDLMPTMLQELALEVPESVEGRSLSGVMRGGGAPHKFTLSEDLVSSSVAIRQGRWKLLYQVGEDGRGRINLFDLKRRPVERIDAGPSNPQVVTRLTRELDRLVNAGAGESSLLRAIKALRAGKQQ